MSLRGGVCGTEPPTWREVASDWLATQGMPGVEQLTGLCNAHARIASNYQMARTAKDAELESLRKQLDDLNVQRAALEAQIASLRGASSEAQPILSDSELTARDKIALFRRLLVVQTSSRYAGRMRRTVAQAMPRLVPTNGSRASVVSRRSNAACVRVRHSST